MTILGNGLFYFFLNLEQNILSIIPFELTRRKSATRIYFKLSMKVHFLLSTMVKRHNLTQRPQFIFTFGYNSMLLIDVLVPTSIMNLRLALFLDHMANSIHY